MLTGMLARALKHNWANLSEEIGLWIPLEVVNKEHGDKPQDEEDLGNAISNSLQSELDFPSLFIYMCSLFVQTVMF